MNTIAQEVHQFGVVWPQCVARAWQDSQFREALKRDPVRTLQESYQFTVPAGVRLQIVESDEVAQAAQPDLLRMVLPPVPDMEIGEIARVGPDADTREARFTFSFSFSLTFCTC